MNRFPLRWRREHLKTDTSEYDSADDPDHAQGNAEETEHERSEQEKEKGEKQCIKTGFAGNPVLFRAVFSLH